MKLFKRFFAKPQDDGDIDFDLMGHVISLVHGEVPRIWRGERITVMSVDGCMTEQLNPIYSGKIVRKYKVPTNASDIAVFDVRVEVIHKKYNNLKIGQVKREIHERVRKTKCGRKIVCN